jgi:hypothetical protein
MRDENHLSHRDDALKNVDAQLFFIDSNTPLGLARSHRDGTRPDAQHRQAHASCSAGDTLAEVDVIRCGGWCRRTMVIGFAMDGTGLRTNA